MSEQTTTEPRLRDMPIRDAAATLLVFLPIVALFALGNRVADWLYDRGVGRENPDTAYARGYRKGVEDERKATC